MTCVFVGEEDERRKRRMRGNGGEEGRKGKFLREMVEFFRRLWWTVKDLPEKIAQACKVQVASWMAWFPFLFYNTTYIGELGKLLCSPLFLQKRRKEKKEKVISNQH